MGLARLDMHDFQGELHPLAFRDDGEAIRLSSGCNRRDRNIDFAGMMVECRGSRLDKCFRFFKGPNLM